MFCADIVMHRGEAPPNPCLRIMKTKGEWLGIFFFMDLIAVPLPLPLLVTTPNKKLWIP